MNNTVKAIWEREGTFAEYFWKNGKLPFPVYDVHGHMGKHNAIYFARCEAPEMVAHMERAGVAKLIYSHHYTLFDSGFRNRRVYDITRQYPEQLRMYVSINPHNPEHMKEDLACYDKWSPLAVGLKFLPDYHATNVNDPKYEYALKFANERGLPILFHTWGGSGCDGADTLLKTSEKYTNIIYFFGHSFSGDWEGAKRVHEQSPARCYFELTSLPGQAGVIERLVQDVGSESILYGTDLPWFDEFQGTGAVLCAEITEDDKYNILSGNVERIFGKNW